MLLKKNLLLFMLVFGISLTVVSCGNKNEEVVEEVETDEDYEETFPTPDEDGNIVENVVLTDAKFHKEVSRNWRREEPSEKEERNYNVVKQILDGTNLEVDSSLFECSYGEIDEDLSVWNLMFNKKKESLNNYGVIIRNEGDDYKFEKVCHGKNSVVDYDGKNTIFMASDVVEGSGTHTEALYVFEIKRNGSVEEAAFLDPFEVVNYFADNMTYDVLQNDVSFMIDGEVVAEMTNSFS